MNLIDFYKSILQTAGVVANDEGFLHIQFAKENKKPFLVNGKSLVLPLDMHLRNPNPEKCLIFHPLRESIIRGESEIVTKFRETISTRLNFIIGYVGVSLLQLAISPKEHSRLTPEQTEFLTRVTNTDEGTLERFAKIIELMMIGDTSRNFSHIRVQKNGTINGIKHRRVGVVYFPFYEEIKKVPAPKEPNEIYGVKLRKIDREVFTAMMEYIFQDIDKPMKWMFPSDSEMAPTLEALLKSVIGVGDPINTVVELFKDHIVGYEDLLFNGEWETTLQNLNDLKTEVLLIPEQPGNEGRMLPASSNIVTVDSKSPIPIPVQVQQTTVTTPPVSKPQHIGQSVEEVKNSAVKPPSGGIGAGVVERPQMQQVQQVVQPVQQVNQWQPQQMQPMPYQQPQQMQPMVQPNQGFAPGTVVNIQTPNGPMQMIADQNGQLLPIQQQMQQPVMYPGNFAPQQMQPMQPQPQPLRHTGRGLDFNSVLAANPAMSMVPGYPGQMQQPGMYQQQQRTPGWAQGGGGGGYRI